ncbi:MAG: hypothetical protein IKN78_09890 [Bacteroidales bacterium]|nr:hypothetical protein [Bacteroidales bacterium]
MAELTEKEKKEMGFPFKEFPTKSNKETWAEWERRCKRMGFDTNEICAATPTDALVAMYRDEKVRNLSDIMRGYDPEILEEIKPSNEIAPYDWGEHYKKMYEGYEEEYPEIFK